MLQDRHAPSSWRLARILVPNLADAEDVVVAGG